MKATIDFSVIILSYNTRELLRSCLAKVFRSVLGRYTMEVIVCDNGSADESIELVEREFPLVSVINNRKNLGFAAGNNPGIKRSNGRYVVLLNSDTEVNPDTFSIMISYMDKHMDVGAATCKLILPDGSVDPACHRGFPTPWAAFTYIIGLEKLFPHTRLFGEYHQGYKRPDTIHEVDCISGAFFLVRQSVIDRVGLLDEEYYFYGEDMDWAFRIRKAGWNIVYNPNVSVLHKKKQSGRAHSDRERRVRTERYFYRYNKLFYQKNYASRYPAILMRAIYAFFDLRLFMLTYFSF